MIGEPELNLLAMNPKRPVQNSPQDWYAYWPCRQLSIRRADLPLRQPSAEEAARAGAREAAGGRALGHNAGPELHLRPSEPVIKKYDLDMFYIAGPGHGGPAIVGNVYLEGTWSAIYPNVTQDEAGLKGCSSNSRSQVESPATLPRPHPVLFTKVESLDTLSAMPLGPHSTIPTW